MTEGVTREGRVVWVPSEEGGAKEVTTYGVLTQSGIFPVDRKDIYATLAVGDRVEVSLDLMEIEVVKISGWPLLF